MLGQLEIADAPGWLERLAAGVSATARAKAKTATIPEGRRNAELTSVAGRLRYRNVPGEELRARLHELNRAQCNPPLGEQEVDGIVDSVLRYEHSSFDVVKLTLNDAGNSDRLIAAIRNDIRYVQEWGIFIKWDRARWQKCDEGTVIEEAKQAARNLAKTADACQDLEVCRALQQHATRSLNVGRLRAVCELAKHDPRLRVAHDRVDAKPFLLAVKNGVVNLKTGKLQRPRKADFLMRSTPIEFDADAACPQFKRFLRDITAGNKWYGRYIIRLLGYLLTGSTEEQKLFFLYGSGANGKSTLLTVIRELLGAQLVSSLPAGSLMRKPYGRSSTNDLARLDGVRVVLSNEIEEGCQFDEPLLKAMTGGDAITARMLYKEFFDFLPKFKLLIAGNHQPVIKGEDHGIWRRVELLPFEVRIPADKRDSQLPEKLRRELPGILALAVRGCIRWQKERLMPPKVVRTAGETYKKDMDTVGKWIDECAVYDERREWAASEAYASYRQWSETNGTHPMSNAAFGKRIKSRFRSKRTKRGMTYVGLGPNVRVYSGAGFQ